MRFAGEHFHIAPSTVSHIIRQTCNAIYDELWQDMFPPLTEERIQRVMDGFWQKWQFPNCFGAIDGRHCIVQVSANAIVMNPQNLLVIQETVNALLLSELPSWWY